MDDSELSDFDVIQRVLERQPAATDEFLARVGCVPRILEALNRTSGRPLQSHDVEDLAQHVFAEMMRRLREFPPDGILDRWAYHFCTYSFLNRVRALRRSPTLQLDASHDPPSGPAPDDELLDIGQFHAALAELSAEQRDLVLAKVVEGRTFEEIGLRTKRSPNTLKSWYYASIERLRVRLAPKFGDTETHPRPRPRLAGGGSAP
ncbi:MAG: sigma-70 family RNA polymerase sigma factor [Planctomycetes bacterium]|nr:sigma-70 family RNA polymerase sigma factor [Planctomycetota bacterium]MCC7172071.1 sigma-70 family RNA polymerase sigma factor [Planctomycetota bacterium]